MKRLRSETAVELDRRLVPVEDGPFEPATLPLDRQLRQMHEQLLADAVTAPFRFDEQILEINTRLSEES